MPTSFTAKRSPDTRATADRLFPHIADFNEAIHEWDGNRPVGQGRMEILESTLRSNVPIDLQFMKPFKVRNVAEFTFDAHGRA